MFELPGRIVHVQRFKVIDTIYTNLLGKEVKLTLKGNDAIVFQHEHEHTLGKCIVDQINNQQLIKDESVQKIEEKA